MFAGETSPRGSSERANWSFCFLGTRNHWAIPDPTASGMQSTVMVEPVASHVFLFPTSKHRWRAGAGVWNKPGIAVSYFPTRLLRATDPTSPPMIAKNHQLWICSILQCWVKGAQLKACWPRVHPGWHSRMTIKQHPRHSHWTLCTPQIPRFLQFILNCQNLFSHSVSLALRYPLTISGLSFLIFLPSEGSVWLCLAMFGYIFSRTPGSSGSRSCNPSAAGP